MLQIVKQRPYIENFCEFVSSFAITEEITIGEMELVESNLRILLDRIQELKNNKIEPMIKDKSMGFYKYKPENCSISGCITVSNTAEIVVESTTEE